MKKVVKLYVNLLLAALLLLLLWWFASIMLQKNLLPSPIDVVAKIPELFTKGMTAHLLASCYRIFCGLFVAILGGFLIGWGMASIKSWSSFFDGIIYLTYPIPKMAVLPIVMLLGGLGDLSKIIMIVLIVLPQVVVAVRDSLRQIPKNYYDVYSCLRANGWQKFWQITFPAVLPGLFSSIRVSLGTAISVLFFTENYGTQFGMGYFIMDSWMRMDYLGMYGGILLLSCLGLVLFLLLDGISALVLKWQQEDV